MPFVRRLLQVELVSLVALALCAALFAIMFVLLAAVLEESARPIIDSLWVLLSLAYVVYLSGVLPIMLIGAPIYTALEAHGRATAVASVVVGLIPGMVIFVVSVVPSAARLNVTPAYSLIYAVCGVSVGAATHLLRTWKQEGRGDA
jgi:hypothetical protein